jgi:hypothetical protein
MPSAERHPDSRHPAPRALHWPAGSSDSTLSDAELTGRCLQLRRKLSSSSPVWHSGRIDRLAEALHSLEEEMRRRSALATQ